MQVSVNDAFFATLTLPSYRMLGTSSLKNDPT